MRGAIAERECDMRSETEYKEFTVRELVEFVMSHPKQFKQGMDTRIRAGDFEGNYNHTKFILSGGGDLTILFELND